MPNILSRSAKHFSSCRSAKRFRAFSAITCGINRRRSSWHDRAPKFNAEDGEESKLRKGTILVAENADGSVLFQFEPNVTHSQVGTAVKVLSVGKQRKSLSKLERIANGENMHSQLKYKLWEPASTANTPYDRSASTSASAADQSSDAQQASHRLSDAAVNNHSEDSPTGAQPQMNGHAALEQRQDAVSRNARETLSLLLGQNHSPLSSDRYSEPELSRQYAFATTRDSSAASATQPSSLQKPALLQKPVRPAAQEPPTSAPLAQDYSRSYAGREHEKRVPCYLWHESGVPKRVELSSFSTEGASEDSDEAVSTSDSPSTIAESGAGFSQHQTTSPAPDNAVQKAWKPIRQFLLWLWRLLPYWFRKLLVRSQQWEPPSVHASAILSQHATSQHRRHAVKGSTYDIVSGRSPTPLIDLERYQIEQLVSMGVRDVELYRTALTAPSAVSSDNIAAGSFDRLEFLGDAVVNLAFRSWVYNRFPKDDEGSMTNTANTLVSNRAHVQYANQLHLTSYIAQNLKYMRPTARVDEDVVADAFEALVGAVYLDRGLQAASDFVVKLAEEVMGLESDLSSYRNYKLYLVNNVNHAELGRVSYISRKRGRNMWQSKCRLQGKLLGIGLDKQRKQAESAAAYAAMEALGFEDYAVEPVGLRQNPGPPPAQPINLPPSQSSRQQALQKQKS